MTTAGTTFLRLPARVNIPRLLAVLTVALALVAIHSVRPDDASAMRMSERTANRRCASAGGSMYYDFLTMDFSVFDMTCTLPSGASFTCIVGTGEFANMVDCY